MTGVSTKNLAENRAAFFNYHIEERYEAGLVLQGWEVKTIRAGRAQLKEAYVILKEGAFWLLGSHMSPLKEVSTHIQPEPTRTRKLLLHRHEIKRLIGRVKERGYTLVPLNLHLKKGHIKLDFALAKGKKLHDKRESEKERDWQREKQRVLKGERS